MSTVRIKCSENDAHTHGGLFFRFAMKLRRPTKRIVQLTTFTATELV